MPNRLTENLDSDLIEAFAELRSDNVLHRVRVYVEGHEDEAFWYDILKDYSIQKNIEFDITPLSRDNSLAKGKLEVLKHAENTGTHLILCVDSDYDYLLPNHSDSSIKINPNPYIFQTYAYSIENLQCYKESLQGVCVRATNNSKQKINLSKLLKLYSNIVYPLLLWSLYFASKKDTTTFTISDFSTIVKLPDNIDINAKCEAAIREIKQYVDTKLSKLNMSHLSDIQEVEALSRRLHDLGLNKDTAYLFMKGHTLFDDVVLRILRKLNELLIKEKEREIRDNAINSKQQIQEISHHQKKTIKTKDIHKALATNTDFKPCFLYQKIKQDLDLYIQNFN